MTVIDCFRGNDISVFTYTILVVAAFATHIEFLWSAGVFVFFTALLNVLFYIIPEIDYTNGMRVNSIYACVLAFLMLIFVSYQNKNSKAMEIKNEQLLKELALAKLEKGEIVDNRMPSGIIMVDAGKLLNIPDLDSGYSFRYGGEEFLIIYYDIKKDRLKSNVETIFNSIREDSFIIDSAEEKKITVSMGVFFNEGKNLTIYEMIKNADEALYGAKEQGRDRIVWYHA